MSYIALSALMDAGDQRSHREWVLATLYERYPDLHKSQPDGFVDDMASLLDAAAARAVEMKKQGA